MSGAKDQDVVIDVRGLNKHFGDNHAVRDLALSVWRGEIFGFLGPNGSGKTTSIRMLCGLLTPDSGEGTCLGYDILRETKEIKRHVGYMTQRFSFWEDLTIRCPSWDSPSEAISLRVRFRAAGNSGSRLPRACCTSLSFYCSTNPRPASIPRRGATSGTNCMRLPRAALPCWSARITWTRPSAATSSATF